MNKLMILIVGSITLNQECPYTFRNRSLEPKSNHIKEGNNLKSWHKLQSLRDLLRSQLMLSVTQLQYQSLLLQIKYTVCKFIKHFKFQGIMVHYHLPCTEFHISMDLIKLRFNQHNVDPNTENNADKSNVPSAKSMNRIIKL